MHVFVTGATGWVGSAVVGELRGAGHTVSGLVRSEAKGAGLASSGVDAVLGTLDDHDVLREAALAADAVVHTAFNHDFSRLAASGEQERLALEAIGEAVLGSARRLLVTSGVAMLAPGRVATEDDVPWAGMAGPRKAEAIARGLADRGANASTVRLAPSVHGAGDHGFVPVLVGLAREAGVSAYVGDGLNRWPAVHRSDVARLYRLALEHDDPMPAYHAIGEEGVAFRDVAELIGRRLGVTVESRDRDHFGWLGTFAGADMPASGARTRAALGWDPTGPTLASDLAGPSYFEGAASCA